MILKFKLIYLAVCFYMPCLAQNAATDYYRQAYLDFYKGGLKAFNLKNNETSNNLLFKSNRKVCDFEGRFQKVGNDTLRMDFSFTLDSITDYHFNFSVTKDMVVIEVDRRTYGLETAFLNDFCNMWKLNDTSYLVLFNDFRYPNSKSLYFKIETK